MGDQKIIYPAIKNFFWDKWLKKITNRFLRSLKCKAMKEISWLLFNIRF